MTNLSLEVCDLSDGSLYMQITTVSVVNFTCAVCCDVKTRSAYFSSFFIISESLFLIFRIWLISLSLLCCFLFLGIFFYFNFFNVINGFLKGVERHLHTHESIHWVRPSVLTPFYSSIPQVPPRWSADLCLPDAGEVKHMKKRLLRTVPFLGLGLMETSWSSAGNSSNILTRPESSRAASLTVCSVVSGT